MSQIAESEKYLDGFLSPSIRSRRLDLRPCGVYMTEKRIFLVRSSIYLQIAFIALWIVAFFLLVSAVLVSIVLPLGSGTPLGDAAWTSFFWIGLALLFIFIGLAWYRNFSIVPIQELEKRKVWEIQRDQIKSTEMTRNSLSNSSIEIHLKSGEKHSIFFTEAGSFDCAKLLFSR